MQALAEGVDLLYSYCRVDFIGIPINSLNFIPPKTDRDFLYAVIRFAYRQVERQVKVSRKDLFMRSCSLKIMVFLFLAALPACKPKDILALETPAQASTQRQVAFVSTRDGNEEIYAMNPDG